LLMRRGLRIGNTLILCELCVRASEREEVQRTSSLFLERSIWLPLAHIAPFHPVTGTISGGSFRANRVYETRGPAR
jgi:hypothetical protein